jgi:hypothetical protein
MRKFVVFSKVTIRAQLAHYGHTCDVVYTPLSNAVRDDIAELLRELHRVEDIPDILRQSLCFFNRFFLFDKKWRFR